MAVARRDAIHDVDVEFEAGRLDWSCDSVCGVAAPFPRHGRRLDSLPDDEGSERASADDTASSSTDDDDDDGGGGGAPADTGVRV